MAEGDKAASVENIPPSLRRPTSPASSTAPQANATAVAQRYGLSIVPQDESDPKVWVSDEQKNIDPAKWPTLSQFVNTGFASMSDRMAKEIFSKMDEYYSRGGWGVEYVQGFLEKAAKISSDALTRGEYVPVADALDNLLRQAKEAGLTPGGGKGGGGPKVTKAIKLTDPQTAETLVDQALQQYLGRKASNQEVNAFRKALGAAERGAPTEVDVMGDTQVTSGGFNPAVFAQQYAEGMEGAAEYQAATTFLDAFIGAIGPRVEL